MKTLKLGFAALLLTLAVGASAFKNAQAAPKADDPIYDWSGSGPDGSGATSGNIDHAQDFYGCSGNAAVCATGVNQADPLDVQTIRLNN